MNIKNISFGFAFLCLVFVNMPSCRATDDAAQHNDNAAAVADYFAQLQATGYFAGLLDVPLVSEDICAVYMNGSGLSETVWLRNDRVFRLVRRLLGTLRPYDTESFDWRQKFELKKIFTEWYLMTQFDVARVAYRVTRIGGVENTSVTPITGFQNADYHNFLPSDYLYGQNGYWERAVAVYDIVFRDSCCDRVSRQASRIALWFGGLFTHYHQD